MKAYFALSYSPNSEMDLVKTHNIKNVLTSYYVLSNKVKFDENKYKDVNLSLFLDSGAFTAFTKGINIELDDYIDFIKKTKKVWSVYATLDVIGDYKATQKNTEYIESKGLKPLPVFHYGSPESELKRLCEKYDYIALGGLVPLALQQKKMKKWLDYCFSIIKTNTKVHGFGVNALWAWKRYPFYSVDATSWNQGSKYGRVQELVNGNFKDLKKDNKVNFIKYHHEKDWRVRTTKNIDSLLKAERYATKLWESRGVKWD